MHRLGCSHYLEYNTAFLYPAYLLEYSEVQSSFPSSQFHSSHIGLDISFSYHFLPKDLTLSNKNTSKQYMMKETRLFKVVQALFDAFVYG